MIELQQNFLSEVREALKHELHYKLNKLLSDIAPSKTNTSDTKPESIPENKVLKKSESCPPTVFNNTLLLQQQHNLISLVPKML